MKKAEENPSLDEQSKRKGIGKTFQNFRLTLEKNFVIK